MTSLYPTTKDRFRIVVELFEECVGAWLRDYFDAIIACETELGIKPSGTLGTIQSRLFATGNLSETTGTWQRITQNAWVATSLNAFGETNQYGHVWSIPQPSRYAGQKTVWGDGIPAPFFSLRSPLKDTLPGATSEIIQPWRHVFALIDEATQRIGVVARSGDNRQLQVGGLPAGATAVGTTPTVHVLFWNLYTGGTTIAA